MGNLIRRGKGLLNDLSISGSKRLAKLTSLGYIGLYALTLVGFAYYYAYKIPDQFYHSTSKYEAHLKAGADGLLEKLKRSLVEQVQNTEKSTIRFIPFAEPPPSIEPAPPPVTSVPTTSACHFEPVALALEPIDSDDTLVPVRPPAPAADDDFYVPPSPRPLPDVMNDYLNPLPNQFQPAPSPPPRTGYEIETNDVEFYRLKVDDDYLIFTVRQKTRVVWGNRRDQFIDCNYTVKTCISCSHYGSIDHPAHETPPSSDYEYLQIRPVENSPEGTNCGIPSVFPYSETFGPELRVRKDLSQKLTDFIRAVNGFPANTEGTFWRMLYLSATTITTLGFGDIVPLTNTARTCVGIEAVLGVALFGLFLNALAHEIDSHARK